MIRFCHCRSAWDFGRLSYGMKYIGFKWYQDIFFEKLRKALHPGHGLTLEPSQCSRYWVTIPFGAMRRTSQRHCFVVSDLPPLRMPVLSIHVGLNPKTVDLVRALAVKRRNPSSPY